MRHWYLLRQSRSNLRIDEELGVEADRRLKSHLPVLDYFAPVLTVVEEAEGRSKAVRKPLYLNYVFMRGTLDEIRQFRQSHPRYSLIRRFRDAAADYLYVSDEEMRAIRIIAKAYSDSIPCEVPGNVLLNKGDRVRIIGGDFAGVEGILLTQKGKDGGCVVINVCNQFIISTLAIKPEFIEVVSFASDNKHVYYKLDSYYPRIRRAMRHYLSASGMNDADHREVAMFITRFGRVELDSEKIRGRYLAYMLMSHTVMEDREKREYFAWECAKVLPHITNEVTRAFIFTALYACMRDDTYADLAGQLVSGWDAARMGGKQKDVAEDLTYYQKALREETMCRDSFPSCRAENGR